ncbi:UxaA family hydrolase [Clostridium sp. DL1XJH146]
MKPYIRINTSDNVVVALQDLDKDTIIEIDDKKVKTQENIKKGHKVALKDIKVNENIIKYGSAIGHAIADIEEGKHIHTHNIKTNLKGIEEYTFSEDFNITFDKKKPLSFKGYVREDNQVGIRNELWVVPTVGCVNGIGQQILEEFKLAENPEGTDAMEVLKHNYGCSQLGDDHKNTRRILEDIVKHPNAGGVLVLGLGCENNEMKIFIENLGDFNDKRVKFLVAQDVEDEIEEGVKLLKELYGHMKNDKREDVPISKLKVGLKCGGSDGLSGITANPLLGAFSDSLIAQGGTTILTEVPEMFGAETILMDRCINEEVFNKTVHLINDFKEYFMSYNQPVYENPSPGNKAGGITTLEDKSLGCTQKGGTAPVVDVLKYGEILKTNGLNLLSAPGNDLVASTALASSGCHIVLFTTGRGTPFGTFVPTMKVSSNSEIYNKKQRWIDFNAGVLVEDKSMDLVVEDFMQYIIEVASGKLVNNEINNFKEIAIFKNGVTL